MCTAGTQRRLIRSHDPSHAGGTARGARPVSQLKLPGIWRRQQRCALLAGWLTCSITIHATDTHRRAPPHSAPTKPTLMVMYPHQRSWRSRLPHVFNAAPHSAAVGCPSPRQRSMTVHPYPSMTITMRASGISAPFLICTYRTSPATIRTSLLTRQRRVRVNLDRRRSGGQEPINHYDNEHDRNK